MRRRLPRMPLFDYDPEVIQFKKRKQPFCVIYYSCSVCGHIAPERGLCIVSATSDKDNCSSEYACRQQHALLSTCEEHGDVPYEAWYGDDDEDDGECWSSKPGSVYILRAAKTNLYKIGASEKDVSSRLKALQTGCPYRLSIFRSVAADNCSRRENQLHALLTSYRMHGEWFDIPDESILTEAINGILWDGDTT